VYKEHCENTVCNELQTTHNTSYLKMFSVSAVLAVFKTDLSAGFHCFFSSYKNKNQNSKSLWCTHQNLIIHLLLVQCNIKATVLYKKLTMSKMAKSA